jgi:hypothetical protein
MNDLSNLMVFLAASGVEYKIWTGEDFIDEEAVKDGAIMAISIRDAAHMNFDAKGRLVGSSTDSAKSYKKRKK